LVTLGDFTFWLSPWLSGTITKNSNYADLLLTHLLTSDIPKPLRVLFSDARYDVK